MNKIRPQFMAANDTFVYLIDEDGIFWRRDAAQGGTWVKDGGVPDQPPVDKLHFNLDLTQRDEDMTKSSSEVPE